MALVTTKRNVDVLPGQAAPTVFHCSQHDVGATVILGLVNAGSNFSIPSGVTAIIQGSCSNGAVFTPVTATVSGSDITFNLSAEMTSIAGPTVCEAVLSKDTDVLGTANFILDVEPSAMGSDTPPVFTDAAWLWMVDKMGTETVSALGDKTVIDAIESKLDKNQGTANAGKYLKVGADGDVTAEDLDVTTDKTLSIADKAADAKAVGDEITTLKADLKIPENIGGNSAGDLAIDYRTGETTGTTSLAHTDYVDLTGVSSIIYTRITSTSTSSYAGMAFYDVDKVYVSGQRYVAGASEHGYKVTELNVPSTAKYARFSIAKNLEGFFVNTKEAYENSLSNRVGKLESDVSGLQADISGLDIVNMDDITWKLGFALTATGYTSTAANSAISPFLPVKNEVYTRSGSATDAEENSYSLWFHQYAGNDPSTWISRTAVSVGNSITLDESCKYFRIGYVKLKGNERPAITTEDIENTFGLYYKTTMQSITERINVLENYHPSYTGKKLSILGDSISTFVASSEKVDGKAPEGCITNYPGNVVQYQNSDVTSVNLTWWGQVLEQFDMTLGINESWAGSCIGYNSSQTSGGKYTSDNCLCSQTRIGHLGENGTPDIIIVFGGTNDINHHRVGTTDTMRYAVGELDSEHNPYDYDNFPMITETYYGSITTMLLRIQHTYPNAVILMLLPYFCTSTHTSSGDRATPYDQNEWSKAAIDVCKYLGVEYLDLRTIINLYDVSSLLFDGLHPKANGMAAIAKAVIHKLNNML